MSGGSCVTFTAKRKPKQRQSPGEPTQLTKKKGKSRAQKFQGTYLVSCGPKAAQPLQAPNGVWQNLQPILRDVQFLQRQIFEALLGVQLLSPKA